MKAQFFDRQDTTNSLNRTDVKSLADLQNVLGSVRDRPPFYAELLGDNGFKLLLGLGPKEGGVQFSSVKGEPPYLMAVTANGGLPRGRLSS